MSHDPPIGRQIRITGGQYAFVPDPLPPPLSYSETMVRHVHDAAAALGGVASIGDFVPNPRLLVVPFLSIEAEVSSRIEGTVTTLPDLFESRMVPDEDVSAPTREVANYLQAMSLGVERLRELPISVRLTRELHRALLRGVRGRNRAPGEFRSGQVHIGAAGRGLASARYVPPPAHLLGELMSDWERFLHSGSDIPALVQCALMHAQFEMIHPFWDGNGRVGRLLLSLFLIATGSLSQPLLFLSAYFERSRHEYYERLLAVSRDGDWPGWIEYFLSAVEAQSRVAVAAARNIIAVRDHIRDRIGQARTGHAMAVIDLLFEWPAITIPDVADRLNVSYPTARRAVRKLEEESFLNETTGQRRNQRFLALPIVEALEVASGLSAEEVGQPPLQL